MKIQVLLLFQIMNSFCYEDFYTFFDENDNLDMKPKIIAGAEPLDLRHWNFIAVIEKYHRGYFKYSCDGSLISSDCILTSGQCLLHNGEPIYPVENLIVRLGIYNMKKEKGQQAQISHLLFHPKFDSDTYENDIAIIKLVDPVEETANLKYARLANLETIPESICKAAGWRLKKAKVKKIKADDLDWEEMFTFENYEHYLDIDDPEEVLRRKRAIRNLVGRYISPSEELLEVELPVVPHEECIKYYKLKEADTIFCTSSSDGDMKSCMGDPGGPIVCDSEYKLMGITSRGTGCQQPYWPGIYVMVSKYEDWIADNCNVSSKKKNTVDMEDVTDTINFNKLPLIMKMSEETENRSERNSKSSIQLLSLCMVLVYIINISK